MSKVQNFAEIAPNIPFTEFNFYDLYRKTFENSELGRIKRLLPLHEMAENLGLVRKSMKPKLCRKLTDATCYESEMRYPTDQRRHKERKHTHVWGDVRGYCAHG